MRTPGSGKSSKGWQAEGRRVAMDVLVIGQDFGFTEVWGIVF